MVVPRSSGSRGVSSPPDPSSVTVAVPKLNKDPVWSLRPWPVTVRLGHTDLEIPAMPAADWLTYLMQETPDLDGMLIDLLPDSDELLFEGKVTVDELYEALIDLIETVCARRWWIALRQIQVARSSWQVLGPQMLEKVDFERVSIAAWLDVLLTVTISAMDPKDVAMFTSRLEAPPPELKATVDPMEEMEMDRGAFLSMG